MPYFTSIQSGAYGKMYSDSPSVVETGIIISKYEAKCFVADSFLKISGCSTWQQQGEGIGLIAILQE